VAFWIECVRRAQAKGENRFAAFTRKVDNLQECMLSYIFEVMQPDLDDLRQNEVGAFLKNDGATTQVKYYYT